MNRDDLNRPNKEELIELALHWRQEAGVNRRIEVPHDGRGRCALLAGLHAPNARSCPSKRLAAGLVLRWFVGLNIDDEVWATTALSIERDGVLERQ
jgi:hypothetical protein